MRTSRRVAQGLQHSVTHYPPQSLHLTLRGRGNASKCTLPSPGTKTPSGPSEWK